MERYEQKHKIIRSNESDELKINEFDRAIALLVYDGKPADGSSEIGRIINVLKNDTTFIKCAKFLNEFKHKIASYDE